MTIERNKRVDKKIGSSSAAFELVAIRCDSKDSIGCRKLKPGQMYFFSSKNRKDGEVCVEDLVEEFMRLNVTETHSDSFSVPSVKISAIVGKNGSGKSSLIEFMMRLINNFAASLLGEVGNSPASARLHYIDGVRGSLWYKVYNRLYRLNVADDNLSLWVVSSTDIDVKKGTEIYGYSEGKGSGVDIKLGINDKDARDVLMDFFYTVVSNYSLYAYNTKDFGAESDSDDKLEALKESDTDNEHRNWLHGLFHKNDGYRTPIVLTPARYRGDININRENNLGNERMLSLLIARPNLRKINGHLIADALVIGEVKNDGYGYEFFKKELKCHNLNFDDYNFLQTTVSMAWQYRLGIRLEDAKNKPYYEIALNYLLYKTIKIVFTYPSHEIEYDLEYFTDYDDGKRVIREIVDRLASDSSHITRKIFRTLSYLIFDIYDRFLYMQESRHPIGFDEIREEWEKTKGGQGAVNKLDRSIGEEQIKREAILPPPFLKSTILLHEEDNPEQVILFETLSSGERQIAYAVSSILYHLDNLESVWSAPESVYRVPYKNVLLVLEEVELYFHPELQQQLITLILEGIAQLNLKRIKGIHILFVTHSPYVLSDIPRGNVLALKEEGMPYERSLPTFGANIHDMLRDSFFLSHGARGGFAQWTIGRILEALERYRNPEEKQQKLIWTPGQIRGWIELIDEPLIRNVLLKEWNDLFCKSELELLEQQKRELESRIKQLKQE